MKKLTQEAEHKMREQRIKTPKTNFFMEEITNLRKKLESEDDLHWFDSICELLKTNQKPTTYSIARILGLEFSNLNNQIRGSMIIEPFDKRFDRISLNPILMDNDDDRQIEFLGFNSFTGRRFQLNASDIIERFSNYRTCINTYDGGTQVFFYPVSSDFEFTALDFWTEKELDEIENISRLTFNGVAFRFGNRLGVGRDGYSLHR